MFGASGRKLIKALYFLMKLLFTIHLLAGLLILQFKTLAQFAPPVGQPGTTAIYKDSSTIVAWASSCTIFRGLQDVSMPSNGYANVGDTSSAIGAAGMNGVISLGDGGSAILRFATPVLDGTGPDFAVFENGFDNTFLELAFVEVSSDGVNFFKFPAISNTDTLIQTGSFGSTDAAKINNLAGKYRAQYGTPFDLSDIQNNLLLDKQFITHVKVTDVVGCIQNQYCTRDANMNKINDPWPTSFGSGGFDLDAVGVIHQQPVGVKELEMPLVNIFPNPVLDELHINSISNYSYTFYISDLFGRLVLSSGKCSNWSVVNFADFAKGVYQLTVVSGDQKQQLKLIKN
ncbi:MAG: T9SS type A sorting domain-containing protein [Burkholderiales bacterium]|nr:T9SS type A sorting domain-containing protein [Bacteroidia bacterium]